MCDKSHDMKKRNLILLLGATLAVGLAACSSKYDEKNAITGFAAEQCVHRAKTTLAYSEDEYKSKCKGKFISIDAFVVSTEDGLKLSLEYPATSTREDDTFYATIDNTKKFTKKDKITIKGQLSSRTFFGYAEIESGHGETALLTEREQQKRDNEAFLAERKKNQSNIFITYLHCADEAMGTMPGLKCPKPKSDEYLNGSIEGDSISIESMCFFGKRTALYKCTRSGSGTQITKLEFVD